MGTTEAFIKAVCLLGAASAITFIIAISAKYLEEWTLLWVAVVIVIVLTFMFKNS